MKMKIITVLLLCSIVISASDVLAKIIMESCTERAPEGEIIPPRAMVDAVLSTINSIDLATFSECVKENRTSEDSATAQFRSVKLPSLSSKEDLYFVRPALDPYCLTFYGAHLFRYWIVKRNNKEK